MESGHPIYDLHTSFKADRADRRASSAQKEVEHLSRQTERLTLACQAMWELMRENGGPSDDDLGQKMLEIDLRDGKADGKISQKPLDCPHCGKKTNSRREFCVMCGGTLPDNHPFATG